jgi:hypothetical protein
MRIVTSTWRHPPMSLHDGERFRPVRDRSCSRRDVFRRYSETLRETDVAPAGELGRFPTSSAAFPMPSAASPPSSARFQSILRRFFLVCSLLWPHRSDTSLQSAKRVATRLLTWSEALVTFARILVATSLNSKSHHDLRSAAHRRGISGGGLNGDSSPTELVSSVFVAPRKGEPGGENAGQQLALWVDRARASARRSACRCWRPRCRRCT